ncbi:MAG: dienelactone hydrolase [Labilithrix sp.]|nr:dienelactone hydrolase [Labilithrix sp.]
MPSRPVPHLRRATALALATTCALACGDDHDRVVLRPGIAVDGGFDAESGVPPAPPIAPLQTWYLERDASTVGDAVNWTRKSGVRSTLALGRTDAGAWAGTLTDDGGTTTAVDAVDVASSWLTFRHRAGDQWRWYRLRVADGTAAGRYATTSSGDEPPALVAFDHHVSGWNAEAFPLSADALSWDVVLGDARHGRLWVSRDGPGVWAARFKIYAGAQLDPTGEELEEDLYDAAFDGVTLTLAGHGAGGTIARIEARASGRSLRGTLTNDSGATMSLDGTRAALMTYGLGARKDRSTWQSTTRRRIENLMMDGHPAPRSPCTVTLGGPLSPLGGALFPERDDDPNAHPQSYVRTELTLSCLMSNPFDGAAIAAPRVIHGWLSLPTSPPPPEGHRVVVAVNGHGGTADSVMTTDTHFYYGDAFARRGFAVLSIDIKHHPDEPIDGESGVHPPILGDGFSTSDWEEDGERVWDVLRATDWLFARSDIDSSHAIVTGLSMGGEETTLVAALDTRFAIAIPAGYAPDMDVLLAMGGHNCWQWHSSDIREYLDQSDLHALVAPRGLLVQTGKLDVNYSTRTPTWSGDLQVMRKTRVAWLGAESDRVQHYLHYDIHAYHFGDRRPGEAIAQGVGASVDPGARPTSQAWQTDGATVFLAPTVFDVIASWAQ